MGNVNMEATQIIYRDSAGKKNVAEALKNAKGGYDYSTEEYDTNSKWIDGSPIYGKIITFEGVGGTTPTEVTAGLPENASVIDMRAMAYGTGSSSSYTGDLAFPIPKTAGVPNTQAGLCYNKTTGKILIGGNNTNMSTFNGFVEVKYVKATYPPAPETPES